MKGRKAQPGEQGELQDPKFKGAGGRRAAGERNKTTRRENAVAGASPDSKFKMQES